MKHARQKQEDPLNLQSLPLVSPPADGWPAVEAALRRDARGRSLRRYAGMALAAAATVTLAVGLFLRDPVATPGGDSAPAMAMPDSTATGSTDATGAGAPTLDALIALSQRLETRLRLLRAEGGSLPAGAVVYQVELEDLVVQVDEELSQRPESLALWNQRVGLLMDLERLYQDRLRREYHRVASL